ncbi:MAG: VPLPA-CTERM sorting domain-containing protein, partial [Pseudomonadota bacterium]
VAYGGGAITDWFFTTQTGSPVTGGGDLGEFDFGIFFAGSDPSDDTELMGSGLSHIFIAYDDKAGTGAGLDDNHDDYVWKVEVVPLPAAGWLLLAGMGGLAAMKRRKKA